MEQSIKSERAMKLADVVNPKYKNMKEFIMASREYFQTKSEHAADLVNRYLQVLVAKSQRGNSKIVFLVAPERHNRH